MYGFLFACLQPSLVNFVGLRRKCLFSIYAEIGHVKNPPKNYGRLSWNFPFFRQTIVINTKSVNKNLLKFSEIFIQKSYFPLIHENVTFYILFENFVQKAQIKFAKMQKRFPFHPSSSPPPSPLPHLNMPTA